MKKIRMFTTLLLVFAIVMFPGASSAASKKTDPALTALEDKLQTATSQRKDAESALTNARNSLADAIAEKEAIDKKILALEVEIDAHVALISGYEIKIKLNNEKIAAEEEHLASQYQVVRERIRSKREDGSGNFLTVLLEAKGLTEFFTRIDRFSAMLEYDAKLLDSYNSGIAELESLRDELTASKESLAMQMENLEARRSELDQELIAANKVVADAQRDITGATADLERITKIEEQYAAERKEKLNQLQTTSNQSYVGGEFLWPLSQDYTKVSSGWGWRIHPVTKKRQFHNGIDIPAPYGTEIYAVNSGTVVECSYNYADGNYITISHGGGLASFYSHLSRCRVAVGDKVERGQLIGNVGTSGYTTGAHLNLNVYKDGTSVNPMKYFQ